MEAKDTKLKHIRLDVLDAKGHVIQTGEFLKDKIVLGRILSADLRIDDARVSRIHALVEQKGETLMITDLASSHGTFVNGKKVVEKAIKFGDKIKLGFVELRIEKGSGNVINASPVPATSNVGDGVETLIDIDRSQIDSERRAKKTDRRVKNAFPDETRLDERRDGERRFEDEQTSTGAAGGLEVEREDEKRVGQRRRNDRRIFDITSLERRIEERRIRKGDDDILPEDLEKAFEVPSHARELEVTILWGDYIMDVSNYVDPTVLTVGESPLNTYIIPSVGIPDEFPLVTINDDGTAYLALTEDMKGTVRARDKIYSVAEIIKEKFVKQTSGYFVVPLKQDDFAKLSIGNINFFVLYVKPAPRILPMPLIDRDPLVMRTTIGSALLFLLLMVMTALVPKPKPVAIEMVPERFAKIVIKPRPKVPPSKDGLQAKNEDNKQGGSVAGEGGPPKGPEGEVGRKDLPRKADKPQVILPKSKPKEPPADVAKPKPNPVQQRMADTKRARSTGLLKAFSQGVSKDVKSLIDKGEGPEGPGGFDEFGKAVAGFRGKTLEEVGGAGGKGLKGVDVGGGGKTVGIDGPSTKGLGRGFYGDGIGEGISGPGRLGQKGEHAINIANENIQILSGLSKEIINAVVKRHQSEIRACYDSALQRNPGTRGKVVLAFDIQPDGIVSMANVKESSVGDKALENCITSRIRSWRFPTPEAPVVTQVTAYPFYLSPAQ
ncbi:MAG: AgmX/PglI C-terminal domain-containing protein [Deltaproteobacteria bacterium]|nr:AgmX/PglI C-terminal domain-containing protein [Deltaproteobacteria bacterium]MBI3296164.1 AgmX/PglI C-terminal domain-containing protein [Deltaproteobacteria bacterium]